MAGFSIIVMLLVFIMALSVIMWAFEILSILSIIFSAVSLSKSKKYISFGGRYDYRSVKRFHTAAVVFFVFGCISAAITGLWVLALMTDYISDVSRYDDIEAVASMLIMGIFGIGKYVVLMIVGIKSFKKFAQAKDLNVSLCAVRRQSAPNNPYGYSGNIYTAKNTAPYQGANGFGVPPVYVKNDNSGFETNRDASFGVDKVSANEGGTGFTSENKETNAYDSGASMFGDTIPDKICPKCGCVNSGLYKFCTMCGEKL